MPAVAKAGSWIPGADLGRVADFLGIAVEHRPALPVGVLVDRLCRVLATASRLTRQFPAEHLPRKLPNRDRSVLALANHIVEIAAGYLLVEAGSAFDAVVAGALPVRVLDREALDARSRAVVADLRQARPDAQREVGTLYGTTSLHRVLERCTWHAAQHTRQLAFMLRRLGIEPERPLTATDLDGLPVPQAVWDA
ncbi:MAG: hypothetical protein OXK76_00660 [Gammaproteobacteria bacterium]|nr:hypothetical protein [Gammaproteobacteria bacterium]